MLFRISTYRRGDIPMFRGVELLDGSDEDAIVRAREMARMPGADIVIVTAADADPGRVRYRFEKGAAAGDDGSTGFAEPRDGRGRNR